MPFDPEMDNRFDLLADELRLAPAPTADLVNDVIAGACTRLPALIKAGKATRLDRLIEAGAWSDAALAVLEFELPAWKLRRLVCEDGEWLCSLSRQPSMPIALDDTAEATHQVLPLAILGAFLEARRRTLAARATSSPVPQIRPASENVVCCDNFP